MMRLLLLAALCASCSSADTRPAVAPQPEVVIGATLTADDLHNLVACARLTMKDLTPEQMVAVAAAIKHAEQDAPTQATRVAPEKPAEPAPKATDKPQDKKP